MAVRPRCHSQRMVAEQRTQVGWSHCRFATLAPAVSGSPTTRPDRPQHPHALGASDRGNMAMRVQITPEAREILEGMRKSFNGLGSLEAAGVRVHEVRFPKAVPMPDGRELPAGSVQTTTTAFTCGFRAPNKFWIETNDVVWEDPTGRRITHGVGLTGCNGTHLYWYSQAAQLYELKANAPKEKFGAEEAGKLRGESSLFSPLIGDILIAACVCKWQIETSIPAGARVERGADVVIDQISHLVIRVVPQNGCIHTLVLNPKTHLVRQHITEGPKGHTSKTDYQTVRLNVEGDEQRLNWSPPSEAKRR